MPVADSGRPCQFRFRGDTSQCRQWPHPMPKAKIHTRDAWGAWETVGCCSSEGWVLLETQKLMFTLVWELSPVPSPW